MASTWVPDGRGQLDELASSIAGMYSLAEQRLIAALAVQVRAGLEVDPSSVARQLGLGQLRAEAEAVARALATMLPTQVEYVLAVAREDGALAALSELKDAPPAPSAGTTKLTAKVTDTTVATTVQAAGTARGILGSAPAAEALTAELTNSLEEVTQRILRWPDDVYRRAVAQEANSVLLGMATNAQAQARAWQDLTAQGVTGFTDTSGREWNLASYTETATRTATRRAWDAQHEATYKDAGVELVTIAVGSGACKACAEWADKVLRADAGPTGRITVTSWLDGSELEVNVEGTLDDARAHGWRHPNCRCRPVAYVPGAPRRARETTYDEQAEKDRNQLRALERRVRKAKTQELAALTPDQAEAARKTQRATQQRIREHVEATGLKRQRNREQLHLGNASPSAAATKGGTGYTREQGRELTGAAYDLVAGRIDTAAYQAKVSPIRQAARHA